MPQLISGSNFADALITTLVAQSASAFNSASMTGNLSKTDFGLLDTSNSASVYIVLPGGHRNSLLSFGDPNSMDAVYELRIRSFVRDVGDSACSLKKMWQVEKDITDALQADTTLGGSAMYAYVIRSGGWDGMSLINAGGQ